METIINVIILIWLVILSAYVWVLYTAVDEMLKFNKELAKTIIEEYESGKSKIND